MADPIALTSPGRRKRSRIESLKIDRAKIADRVKKFYDEDMNDRSEEIFIRLQRYAKYRMWTEGKDWPWEGCSDVGLPDMMQHSLRVQDTLHNAVMSIRPAVVTKAVNKADAEKQDTVDNLLDYQVFEEQPGETAVGAIIEGFVNDGVFTAYTPWVKDKREVHDVRMLDPIPQETQAVEYFRQELEALFPKGTFKAGAAGWDWEITQDDKNYFVQFFTRDDGTVEIDIEHDAVVYDGPRLLPKQIQDVIHPTRCENLQIPCPANPGGAAHVIIRDFPTKDEIARLKKSGFYDLITEEEAAKLGLVALDTQHQELEQQKDRLQGARPIQQSPVKGAESQGKLTRLMCFDVFDIDDDGIDEDVIWWMILETKTILKAKYLTQMFPSAPPRRPFAEAQFIPVPGRRLGIGILEMMEGLHDISKQIMDQTIDGGTISNVPFFFYKSTSNMRPEVIRLAAGEGYPLTDPKNDVNFPQMPTQGQTFGINMYAMLTQEKERLTNIGELQLGRVPQGKASALRTVSGMQTVLAQGDARPERILRRFFIGLTDIFANFHELNQRFLPKNKQYRISGFVKPEDDPYRQVGSPEDIAGRFQFKFLANALNTNKGAVQQALMQLMGTLTSQLNLQLGLIDPEGIYRMQFDYAKALGVDGARYLKAPSPNALYPDILAEEAINEILMGKMPQGRPAEGAQMHYAKLLEFIKSDEFGHFGLTTDPAHMELFKKWLENVRNILISDQQKQKMLAAAQQFQATHGQQANPQGGPVPGAGGETGGQPPVQANELLDESLPFAGGGANSAGPVG
jgi:hypothetical protein